VSHVLHDHLFLVLTRLIKLAMSLVDVVFDLRELLHSPLAHIDQCLHFFSSSSIQTGQCAVKFRSELGIVRSHKVKKVQSLLQSNIGHGFLLLGGSELCGKLELKVLFQKIEEVKSGFKLAKG
jgi:hypothetical protein